MGPRKVKRTGIESFGYDDVDAHYEECYEGNKQDSTKDFIRVTADDDSGEHDRQSSYGDAGSDYSDDLDAMGLPRPHILKRALEADAKKAAVRAAETIGRDDDERNENDEKPKSRGRDVALLATDDEDDEDFEGSDAEDADAEALQLHRDVLCTLQPQDFELSTVSGPVLTKGDDGGEGHVELKQARGDDLELLLAGFDNDTPRDLPIDVSSKQLRRIIRRDHPEMLALLKELHQLSAEFCHVLQPLLANAGKLTSEGRTYLAVRNQLVTCYLHYLTYYLYLKSQGHSVADHPIIARLVDIKTALAGLQSLHENVQPQVSRLLSSLRVQKSKDTTKAAVDLSSNRDESVDSRDLTQETASDHNNPQTSPTVVYPATKRDIVAALRQRENDRGRHQPSHDDNEEESGSSDSSAAALKDNQRSVRNSQAHSDAWKKKQQALLQEKEYIERAAADAVVDIECSDPTLLQPACNPQTAQALRTVRQEAKLLQKRHQHRHNGDAHITARPTKSIKSTRVVDRHFRGGAEDHETDDSGPTPSGVPSVVQEALDATTSKKQQLHARKRARDLARLPSLDETSHGKRATTYDINKNKGLTRKRKRIEGNARVHNRQKFEKKLKKFKHREGTASGAYEGETTGIRKHLKKSVSLAT